MHVVLQVRWLGRKGSKRCFSHSSLWLAKGQSHVRETTKLDSISMFMRFDGFVSSGFWLPSKLRREYHQSFAQLGFRAEKKVPFLTISCLYQVFWTIYRRKEDLRSTLVRAPIALPHKHKTLKNAVSKSVAGKEWKVNKSPGNGDMPRVRESEKRENRIKYDTG